MRFFSNDKDARDDQHDVDVQERAADENPDQAHDDHPERVQSDPVAVPQQRAGSPWSSTPDTADAADARDDSDAVVTDEERRDDVVDVSPNGHDDDADRPVLHDPVADDDFSRTDSHGDDALRPDDSEVRHDGDDLVPSDYSTTATSETGSHRADLDQRTDLDQPADLDQPVDLPLDDDKDSETVREDTTPPDHAVLDTTPDATVDGTATDSALKDDGDFSDPQAVDPVTDESLDAEDSSSLNHDNTDSTVVEPVVAVVPVAVGATAASAAAGSAEPASVTDSKPGSVTAPDLGTLFAADDAQSFQERWRDVQLRFVDSPKEATSEAAHLVDEAVDKLTAGLKSQKDALSGDNGEDTEKLRVELRGYRDILNRILAL